MLIIANSYDVLLLQNKYALKFLKSWFVLKTWLVLAVLARSHKNIRRTLSGVCNVSNALTWTLWVKLQVPKTEADSPSVKFSEITCLYLSILRSKNDNLHHAEEFQFPFERCESNGEQWMAQWQSGPEKVASVERDQDLEGKNPVYPWTILPNLLNHGMLESKHGIPQLCFSV